MDLAMPRLSDTMEEGTLGRWLKHEGETIEKGEVIAEIQTDKASMELEAFEGGVLERILVQEGETVPIGQAIAVIGSGANGGAASAPAQETEAPSQAAQPEAGGAAPDGEPRPVPAAAARPARRPAASAAGPEGRIKASPIARRLAQEHDLELASIRGTGPNARVTRDDVLKAAAEGTTAEPAHATRSETSAAAPEPRPAADGDVTPFTRIQGIIARRMVESKTQAPHIYLTVEVDMAKTIQLRGDVNALGGQSVSFNDIVIKASAAALRAYPRANRSYVEGGVRQNAQVNIGFAVGLEDNLLVPVIRDADTKSLRQIAAEARDLISRGREGKLSASELSGGTFTVTNLGMYGVEEFGAIINQPESAILAVGAITRKPVVQDDRIVVGDRMRVTLSADHRVLYGTDAAEFLRGLKRLLEEPLNIGF